MKTILLSFSSLIFFACGAPSTPTSTENENTLPENQEASPQNCILEFDSKKTTIEFGAFKFTEKTEVKGAFESFEITKTQTGETVAEIFTGAKFTVYINGLETKDVGRNQRIRDTFFKKLVQTEELTGEVIAVHENHMEVVITMNAKSITQNLNYTFEDNTIYLIGTINVLDWDASEALASLNKACEDLHRGSDGVSKTWAEVNLYIQSELTKICR